MNDENKTFDDGQKKLYTAGTLIANDYLNRVGFDFEKLMVNALEQAKRDPRSDSLTLMDIEISYPIGIEPDNESLSLIYELSLTDRKGQGVVYTARTPVKNDHSNKCRLAFERLMANALEQAKYELRNDGVSFTDVEIAYPVRAEPDNGGLFLTYDLEIID